ncbi:MAG: hypothetical protein ACLFTI_04380 [Anaerolineales bacterium]
MTKFIAQESRLEFEFHDDWQVFQFDEHRDYRKHIQKQVQGTAAIDFLGIHGGNLYLVEVKNFHRYRIQNQPRLLNQYLHQEVGQKARDSVACIVGAYRNSSEPEFWRPFLQTLCNSRKLVKVVLWLEYDLPRDFRKRQLVRASVKTQEFKKKLKWLTTQVIVCNLSESALPDVIVRNLPDPPNASTR